MRFEVSERIKTSKSQEELLSFLEAQFKKISESANRSDTTIKVKSIEASFGAINRDDSADISLKKSEDGWLLVSDVNYKPSAMFWVFFIVGLFSWVFWLLPIGFYLYQKDAVKGAISDCFQRVRNEFEQSIAHVQTQASSLGDIGQLHELFKAGAITQEEFDEQKKKILVKAA
jgi:hypothetical protein